MDVPTSNSTPLFKRNVSVHPMARSQQNQVPFISSYIAETFIIRYLIARFKLHLHFLNCIDKISQLS